MHKAVRNVTRLFERIQDFEKRVIQRRGELCRADAEAQVAALQSAGADPGAVCSPRGRGAAAGRRGGGRPELPGRWPERARS